MPDPDGSRLDSQHDPETIVTEIPSDPQPPSQASDAPANDPSQEPIAESHVGDERTQGEDDQDGEQPQPFPDELKQGFDALMFVGRLSDTFNWLGHEFIIRTLYTGELMDVGLIHKKYAGTLGDIKAYQTAIVAACLVSVDGQPPPVPLEVQAQGALDVDPVVLDRFNYIRKRWFPPTIDTIYERYLLLEKQQTEILTAMGNPSG